MHDIELLAIGSGIVYAIGRALQPSKPNQRETIRYVKRRTPEPIPPAELPARLTTHRYPVRVPVETVQHVEEVQKQAIAPRQPRTRRHTGHGPFGFTQAELTTAQRYLRTGMDAPEYDGTPETTGWIEGISEGETE